MDGEPVRNEYLTSQWSGMAPGSIFYTGGNVGIGTQSANAPLNVWGPGTIASSILNPQPGQLIINTTSGSERLILGTWYTGGVGSYCTIQSSDYYSSLDHGQTLALNPLGGNIGIGTTSPGYALDIGSFAVSTPQVLRLQAASVTGGTMGTSIRLMEANDTYGFSFQNLQQRLGIFRHSASQAGAEAITLIRDTGLVGIGTTSPGYALDINTTTGINLYSTNTTTPLFKMVTFGNHNGSTFWSEDWDGTAGGPGGSMFTMDHSTGQGLYNLVAGGYNDANTFKYGSTRGACRVAMGDASYYVQVSSLSSGATKGSAITFYTGFSSDNSNFVVYTNGGTERMRVNTAGYVNNALTYKYNIFYAPPNWGYSTTSTGWVQLWSFSYSLPVASYVTVSVQGHWQASGAGMWAYIGPLIDGNAVPGQSGYFDSFTAGASASSGGYFHDYWYAGWQGFSCTFNVKLAAGSHTFGQGISQSGGTVYANGSAITLKVIPINYL